MLADRIEADRPRDHFEVHGWEAWRTLNLFLAASTQWRVLSVAGPKGGRLVYLGLDYPAVESAARMAGLIVTPDHFAELRDMEAGALRILNEHH